MGRFSIAFPALWYAIALLLVPVLIVPFLGVSAALQKADLVVIMFGVACIGIAAACVIGRGYSIRRLLLASVLCLPLTLVAAVSALINHSAAPAWLGSTLEFGTIGSTLLFTTAFAAGMLLPSRSAYTALYAFVFGTAALGLIALFLALFGNADVLAAWPILSGAFVAAIACGTYLFDWAPRVTGAQWGLFAATGALVLGFACFFSVVLALVLLGVLACSVVLLVSRWAIGVPDTRLPIAGATVAVLLIGALAFGLRGPILKVPADVRPSFAATQLTISPILINHLTVLLVGNGPATFAQVWDRYHPREFNQTSLWSTTFDSGYSTALTLLTTLGALGLVAWLLPMLVGLAGVLRTAMLALRRPTVRMDVPLAAAAIAALYVASSWFMVTDVSLWLVSTVAAGLACGSLMHDPVVPARRAPLMLRILLAIVCVVLGGFAVMLGVRQLASASYHAAGYRAFAQQDYVTAHDAFLSGQKVWKTPALMSDLSRVSFVLLQQALASSSLDNIATGTLNEPLDEANTATSLDPYDFEAWLSRSSIYVSYANLGLPGTRDLASSSLATAARLAPARPEVPYLKAVLASTVGNQDAARTSLIQALTLKPDYEPALKLQQQLFGQ